MANLNEILDKISEQEKEEAKDIYTRFMLKEYVSIDELYILLRYEKFQLVEARIAQHNTQKVLASNNFELINYNDHSLGGWIKKGLLGANTTATNLKSSSIGGQISKLEDFIITIENEIEKRKNKSNYRENILDKVISAQNFRKS